MIGKRGLVFNAGAGGGGGAAKATSAQILNGTDDVYIAPAVLEASLAEFALTDAATVLIDSDDGRNFAVTLGGNRVLDNMSNAVAGAQYRLRVIQPGSGGPWEMTFAANYTLVGTPSWKTTAGEDNVFLLDVVTPTDIRVYPEEALDAANVSYDNTTSGLTATDVKAALDELAASGGGGGGGGALSGASRAVGTQVTSANYSTETNVTTVFDTSKFDDGWWNASGYYEVPSGVTRVLCGVSFAGLDIEYADIQHSNSSDSVLETVRAGWDPTTPEPNNAGHTGAGLFAVSAGDRFRVRVKGIGNTSNIYTISRFWIASLSGGTAPALLSTISMASTAITTTPTIVAGLAAHRTVLIAIENTNSQNLRMQMVPTGSSTPVANIYNEMFMEVRADVTANSTTNVVAAPFLRIAYAGGLQGITEIMGHDNAVTPTRVHSRWPTAGSERVNDAILYTTDVQEFDRVAFFTSTGSITAGTIKVYGLGR